MKTVVITGADRGVGLELSRCFLQGGWHVFAGQFMPGWPELGQLQGEYPRQLQVIPLDVSSRESVEEAACMVGGAAPRVDILVNNAGISGTAGDIFALENLERGLALFRTNSLGALRMTRAFLPLLERPGGLKRLCFVSSEAGSVSVCHRNDGFIYPMTKAALNMGVARLFGELSPKGYTFRLFHPGWVRSYMSGSKSLQGEFEPEEAAMAAWKQFTREQPREDVLRMVDNQGAVWPF